MPVAMSIQWKPLRDSHYVVASLQPGGGGLRQIFVRQSTLREVQALVRGDPEQPVVGLLLGERFDCSVTLTPYVLIESHVEVALPWLDEQTVADAIQTLRGRVGRRKKVQPLGWFCSSRPADTAVSRTRATVHAACFEEPWQTVLVLGDGGNTGAFFLHDSRAARWFHAPFYEVTDSKESGRAAKRTSVAWPAYITTASVVPIATPPHDAPSPPASPRKGAFSAPVVITRRTPVRDAIVGVGRAAVATRRSAVDIATNYGRYGMTVWRHVASGMLRIRAERAARAAQRNAEAEAERAREEARLAREAERRAKEAAERRVAREEAQRLAAQAEKQRAAEAAARRAAEAEARRKAAEEAKRRRAADAEAKRKKAEAEAEARRQAAEAEAEARRQAAVAEARRRAEEAEARRVAEAEALARRNAAEEAQRQAAREALRKAAEEAQRRAAEMEARRKAAEEARRKAAEEAQRKAAEEEQRRVAEAEARRHVAEAEARRQAAELEARRLAEAEEAQRKAAEEEQRRVAEAEARRHVAEAEARRQAAELEARRLAEAEAEARRRAAEADAEAQRRVAETEELARRKAAEAEALRISVEVAAIRERLARAPVEGSRREAPKVATAQNLDLEDTTASDPPYRFLAIARREGFEVSERIERGTAERAETVWLLHEGQSGLRLIVVTTDEAVREASLHYNVRTEDESLLQSVEPEHRDLESRTIYRREECLNHLRAQCRRLRSAGTLVRDWKAVPSFQHSMSPR